MTNSSTREWGAPPADLILADRTVDVWRLHLDRPPEVVDALFERLSPDERERAERYRVQRAYTCFVLTRAVLRELLASYLGDMGHSTSPDDVDLIAGEHGKPRLHAKHQPDEPADSLQFNVSHCKEWSLLAFSRGLEVGVDVERVRADISKLERVPRWFAAREREALDAYEGAERAEAFFRCWTRKEAFIKATGQGFSTPLDSFAVSLAPEEVRLEWLEAGDADQWEIFSVAPDEAYAGAICVRADSSVYLRTITATVSNSPSVQLDL
ncbi:MAG: 4'-phosphopantetheinyl transferase family protein [Persicimonas sp.]